MSFTESRLVQDLGIQRVHIACIRLFDNEINKFSDWPMSNKPKYVEKSHKINFEKKNEFVKFSFWNVRHLRAYVYALPKHNRVVHAKKINNENGNQETKK